MTALEIFIEEHGGYWGPGHPKYPVEDWRYLVANDEVRQGYWNWCYDQVFQ